MVSLVEYKDYLKQQYERIEQRVLSDESISVLKQLQNKEHLFRRLAEIFDRIWNAERENLLERLLRENHRLREKTDAVTLDESESDFRPSTLRPHSAKILEEHSLERARLLRKNEELVREMDELQQHEGKLVEALRNEIEQLRAKLQEQRREAHQTEDEKARLAHHQQQLVGKLREELESVKKELATIRKLNVKGKECESNLRGQIEVLKNKLARLEVESCSYLSQLEDVQAQLNRSKTAITKKNAELAHLENTKKDLERQCEVLQKSAQYHEAAFGQKRSTSNSELLVNEKRLEEQLARLEEDLRHTKRELEKSKKQALQYRLLYEQATISMPDKRNPTPLEGEVEQLRQQLSLTESSYRLQVAAEASRTKKQHDDEIVLLQREHHRELEQLRASLDLKVKEKQFECEHLASQLVRCQNSSKESAAHFETLKRELDELRQSQLQSSLRDNSDVAQVKKVLAASKSQLITKKRQCDELNLQVIQLREENGKLSRRLLNMEAVQLNSSEEDSSITTLQQKDSVIREMKEHLYSKTVCLEDLQSKLDSSSMEVDYLKSHVGELTNKLEDQRRTINKLEDEAEQARRKAFLTEAEHLKNAEQLAAKFEREAQETREFYLSKLKQTVREEPKQKQPSEHAELADVKRLVEASSNVRLQLERKTLEYESLEREFRDAQEALQEANSRLAATRSEYEKMAETAKEEARRSMVLLAQYETRTSQQRIKFAEFKKEIGGVMRSILSAVAFEFGSLKESLNELRYLLTKEFSEGATALQAKILQHQHAASHASSQRSKRELDALMLKHADELKEIRSVGEQRLNEQILESLTALTEKELHERELQQRLQLSEKSLASSLQRQKELQQKTESLEKLLAEHRQLGGRLERRTRQLQEELTSVKEQEKQQQVQLERQLEKARKLEQECQAKLEGEQRKYSQGNFEMFRRYEKELQKVIQQTASSPNITRITCGPWQTPQKQQTGHPEERSKELLGSIRQEILLQRKKLQSLERFHSPPQLQKPTKTKK